MNRVGIALGSNLGDRLANLHAAQKCLHDIAMPGEVFLKSSIYQTEPHLCPPGSPFFYNSAVELAFGGTAFELLEITQAIERDLGRVGSHVRNAPRLIDLDMLYFGDEVIDADSLVLPHPRLGERRFVLQPLAEILPQLILPGRDRNIVAMLKELRSDESPLIRVFPSEI
jgi:2-amino-4-hydroxy-6-hydroxymethyldihydropteridine diphosphokinase